MIDTFEFRHQLSCCVMCTCFRVTIHNVVAYSYSHRLVIDGGVSQVYLYSYPFFKRILCDGQRGVAQPTIAADHFDIRIEPVVNNSLNASFISIDLSYAPASGLLFLLITCVSSIIFVLSYPLLRLTRAIIGDADHQLQTPIIGEICTRDYPIVQMESRNITELATLEYSTNITRVLMYSIYKQRF